MNSPSPLNVAIPVASPVAALLCVISKSPDSIFDCIAVTDPSAT